MYSIPKNTSKKNTIKKKIDQKNEKPKLTKNELESDVLKQVSILDYFQKKNKKKKYKKFI